MTFNPIWKSPAFVSTKKDPRGAPEAPERYRKALHQHKGEWAKLTELPTFTAAEGVAFIWSTRYPDLEFISEGKEVFGRAREVVMPPTSPKSVGRIPPKKGTLEAKIERWRAEHPEFADMTDEEIAENL